MWGVPHSAVVSARMVYGGLFVRHLEENMSAYTFFLCFAYTPRKQKRWLWHDETASWRPMPHYFFAGVRLLYHLLYKRLC